VKRWIAALPLAGLGALALLFATFGLHHDPHVSPDALVGQATPEVTLPALAGAGAVRIRQQARPGVLINFFASWCAPCLEEQPALMALKAEGASIVGVAYKDDPAATLAMLQRGGDPFTVVLVDRHKEGLRRAGDLPCGAGRPHHRQAHRPHERRRRRTTAGQGRRATVRGRGAGEPPLTFR
jgi:cytochrome c biogenesis protein CcmG/thiol:disulfide interchange protein DsbE